MSASSRKTTPEARLVGFLAGLRQPPEVRTWAPPTRDEVDATPALPALPPRGWAAPAAAIAGPLPAHTGAGPGAQTGAPPAPGSAVRGPDYPEPTRPEWIREGTVHALAWERAPEMAGVIRARLVQRRALDRQAGALEGVAVLCAALGPEVAGRVLRHLSEDETEDVALAVAALESVDPGTAERVLSEAQQEVLTGQRARPVGMGFARTMLDRALGPVRGQEVAQRVSAWVPSGSWATLAKVAPDRIAPFIAHEHPQTIALFLSQLEPGQAAGILSHLPIPVREDVVYRMATLDNVPPSMLRQLAEGLESSLREVLERSETVGGPKVVADVLNVAGSSLEKDVLERLDAQDRELAEAVRSLMFVFEDIANMSDHDIQRLLREIDQQDMVVALKGASPALRERILANVSEQVKEWLRDQDAFLGRMRLAEVEQVQLRIVQQVRQLEEQGEVTVVRGEAAAQLV